MGIISKGEEITGQVTIKIGRQLGVRENNGMGSVGRKVNRKVGGYEDEWTLVTRRKRREKAREEGIHMNRINEKFLNVYISNFPEEYDQEALMDVLKKVGDVKGVVFNTR